jgi:tRNA(Arg) A34 adenosine deaminase TadA
MCLGAIYWARPQKVFYGNSKVDAANIGFDDDFIYNELELPLKDRQIPFEQIGRHEAISAFEFRDAKQDKTDY